MISAPGPLEIMVILAIALIFLGPKRLPDVARSVGKGMREFRESLTAEPEHRYDDDDDFVEEEEEDEEEEEEQDAEPAGERS
jgi:sec-independent protein translocase protein TatA